MLLNDVHSQLNETSIRRIEQPTSEAQVSRLVRHAAADGEALAVSAGRHAMGGQQFLSDGIVIDMSAMSKVTDFDASRGLISVEPGIQWPELQQWLEREQGTDAGIWTFRQKQTGADSLSIGGAVSANVHGRGLTLKPFVDDVESLRIVGPDGEIVAASREANAQLFANVVGGYGVFGVITEVTLRLVPRQRICRVVELVDLDELPNQFEQRVADGFLYGDWQYDIDPASEHFLNRGIFSCYRPVGDDEAQPGAAEGQTALRREDWARLVELVREDKTLAFEMYRQHYLATDGQHYWSDTHQNATYLDNYAELLQQASGGDGPLSTLMISELYVPRRDLPAFLRSAASVLRESDVEVLYGTVRLIERDDATTLRWAREPWACTIFNLLVEHTEHGTERAAEAFRQLIDAALDFGGSYYLTYHRWARAEQLVRAHPMIGEFVAAKQVWDPNGVFRSDWYDHIVAQVAREISISPGASQ
ncbi:MAG: hypothetical protein JWN41_1119 [Thermoleophilia bacterium]|nr:hypothetical protein [Thermoleophilia bacterium]